MKLTDKANVIVVRLDYVDCNDGTDVLIDAFNSYAAAENFIISRMTEELQDGSACGEFAKTKKRIIDLLTTARNKVNSIDANKSTEIDLMSYEFDDCFSEMSSYKIIINPEPDADVENTEYDLSHIMSIECDEDEDEEEE